MSDLTPPQRIEAAIVRLEELRAESAQGPWEWRLYDGVRDSKSRLVRVVEPEDEYGYDRVELLAEYLTRGNADLIVTLHSTINAQLALLRAAMVEHSDVMTSIEKPYWVAVMALADAIISGGTE